MSRLVFNWISGNHETPPQYARDYWTGFKYYHGSGSDSSGQVYELRHLATKVALFPDQVIDEIVNHAFSFIDGNQDEVLKFLSGWKHVRNVIGYMYGIVEGNPAMLQANGVATRSDHVMGIGRTPNAESLDARTLIAQGHTATRQKEANSAQVSSDLAILGIASAITSGLPRIEEKGKDGFQKGGIDLTSDKAMQIKNDGQGGIKFHIDPAQLAQLQNAPGFMPEIISIQPMTDLKAFLGILYDFIIP